MKIKCHITVAPFLAAAAALAALAPSARSQTTGGPLRLEGAWVMKIPGTPMLVTYTLSPTDSYATNAAMYGSTLIGDPTLMGAFTNCQYQTPMIGQAALTSTNSGVFTVLQYGMRMGTAGPEIVYITLNSGTFTTMGSGALLHTNNISVFLPSQDTQGVGLPDPGQPPIACITLPSIHTRLPLLTPCAPRPAMSIGRQPDNSFSISWPPSAAGFTLQSAPNLPSTNWVTVPGVQSNRALIQPTDAGQFYRLKKH